MSRPVGFDNKACREAIEKMRFAGLNIPTIAKDLGVSVSTVSRLQPEEMKRYKLTPEDVAMCAELVNHGLTFKEIAGKFDVSALTVSRKVHKFWYEQAISGNMVLSGVVK